MMFQIDKEILEVIFLISSFIAIRFFLAFLDELAKRNSIFWLLKMAVIILAAALPIIFIEKFTDNYFNVFFIGFNCIYLIFWGANATKK